MSKKYHPYPHDPDPNDCLSFLEYVVRCFLGPPDDESGTTRMWRCPYHDDSNPSFSVFPPKEDCAIKFKCYGCAMWGDENDILRLFKPKLSFSQRKVELTLLQRKFDPSSSLVDTKKARKSTRPAYLQRKRERLQAAVKAWWASCSIDRIKADCARLAHEHRVDPDQLERRIREYVDVLEAMMGTAPVYRCGNFVMTEREVVAAYLYKPEGPHPDEVWNLIHRVFEPVEFVDPLEAEIAALEARRRK